MKVRDIIKNANSETMFRITCNRYATARARDKIRIERGQRGWNPHAITASKLFSGIRSVIKRNEDMHKVFTEELGYTIPRYYL